jgi:hypothetical protein
VLGLPFLSTRRSSFIEGCGRDAETIAQSVCGQFRRGEKKAA